MVARESRPDRSARQSPESESPPETIARWERNRALGRSTFIWRRGVFGWGIPVALVTIAYQVVQEQGFVWRLVLTQHLKTGIAIAMLVFPLCGYLFGRYLWTAGEENYERLLGSRKASAGKRASAGEHRESGTGSGNESPTRPTRHRDDGR
jgi:hypothetical protein